MPDQHNAKAKRKRHCFWCRVIIPAERRAKFCSESCRQTSKCFRRFRHLLVQGLSRRKPQALRMATPGNVPRWQWLAEAINAHKSDQCLLWPFRKYGRGYGPVCFNGTMTFAHRLAFYFANGHWPNPQARHTCDNPPCFNPRHIIEGTRADNARDMVARGHSGKGKPHFFNQGEKHYRAKLTADKVKEIRGLAGSVLQRELAVKYGVTEMAINRVIHYRVWKHLSKDA